MSIRIFSLFYRITFSLFSHTAQSITLTYLPDMAVANGIPRDKSASIISICGITNTIGRILAGFLTDSFHVSSTAIYLVALTVAAVTNFIFPWCYSYLTVALCSGVFGLCMGKFWFWWQFNHMHIQIKNHMRYNLIFFFLLASEEII